MKATTSVVAAAAGLALSASAMAQFSGVYAPANWTFNANGGNGSVAWNAPLELNLIGNDNGFGNINTDLTITTPASGFFTFDWVYNTVDTGTYDAAYYLINGAPTFLANNTTPGAFGTVNVPVNAGDVIGFRVWSADGFFGPGELKVSNFSAPIPTPGVLALAGLGGLAALRRRRR